MSMGQPMSVCLNKPENAALRRENRWKSWRQENGEQSYVAISSARTLSHLKAARASRTRMILPKTYLRAANKSRRKLHARAFVMMASDLASILSERLVKAWNDWMRFDSTRQGFDRQ
jgi:hypothetical protein